MKVKAKKKKKDSIDDVLTILQILEKEMAIDSCFLAWKIPRTENPGGLQSMGLQRVRLISHRTSTNVTTIASPSEPKEKQLLHSGNKY